MAHFGCRQAGTAGLPLALRMSEGEASFCAKLGKSALMGRSNSCNNPWQSLLNSWPTGGVQYNDCDTAACKILLVLQILVRGNEHFESSSFSSGDKLAILQAGPSAFVRCFDGVTHKRVSQWGWRTLIK